MTTRDLLFQGHPIIGRLFTMPPGTFIALFSCSAICFLLLPAWLAGVHLIPCSHRNYGFWLKLNWSFFYVAVLPVIFGSLNLLSSHLEKGITTLCSAPLSVITRKSIIRAPEYAESLSARLKQSARPLFLIALLLTVVIMFADTHDLWTGFYSDEEFAAKIQPDWDTAYTGFAKGRYKAYCKDTTRPCEQITCGNYSPPGKTANLLFDLLPYSFQGVVIFLALFWVGKFYCFLQSFSALMLYEGSPYQFNPLDNPRDPDTRMGLRPIGAVFNGFLILTVIFQSYFLYYRIELVSLARQESRWSYFKNLFSNPTHMDFAFGSLTVTGWILIIFINVPIMVICYFPLWTLYRYVRRRRNDAWEAHARAFADAVESKDEKLAADLQAKMNILRKANVWPNGDATARYFMIISVILVTASIFPPFVPYATLAGLTTEFTLAIWARSARRDEMRASPSQTIQNIFIEQMRVNKMRDNISVQKGIVSTGENANIRDVDFSEVWNQLQSDIDLTKLAQQLADLGDAMKAEAKAPEHYTALAQVISAEQEAKQGNGQKVLKCLSTVGQWTLDIASKIVVPIASEAIKKSIGM